MVLCFATDNDYPVVSPNVSQASPQIRSPTKTAIQILIGASLLATIAVGCASGNPVSPATASLEATPLTVTPTDHLKRIVGITKDIVQIVAIVAAATWASYRFGLFRERIPRGAISHEVTHRPLTDSAIHLSLTVIFSNAGHVLWSFEPARQNLTTIQHVKPITSDHIMILEQQRDVGPDIPYQWARIYERPLAAPLEVEPSDTERVNYEFIIDNAIESILIYPHYGRTNRGWDAAMIYDISGE